MKHLFHTFLLLLISPLISFLMIEFCFRAFFPQEDLYMYELRDSFLFNQSYFSDRTGTLPGNSFRQLQYFLKSRNHPNLPPPPKLFTPHLEFNSQGFRGTQEFSKKAHGKKRILILGDSISMGWPVSIEESYVGRIQAATGQEVINCSVIGANTAYLNKVHEKHCAQFEADLTILQITLAEGKTIPDYLWSDFMGADIRTQEGVWQKRDLEILAEPESFSLYNLAQNIDYQNPEVRHQILQAATPNLFGYKTFHTLRFIENTWLLNPQLSQSPYLMSLTSFLDSPTVTQIVIRDLKTKELHPTLQAIKKIHQRAKNSKSQFAVVFIANRLGIEKAPPQFREDFQLILKKLTSWNIQVLDLATHQELQKTKTYYWSHDVHPNPRGYKLISQEILKALKGL